MRPQPVLQVAVLNGEGNLRAVDIGITWENNETFLHGVRMVGPGPPRPTGMGPVMSTLYQPMGGQDRDIHDSSSADTQDTRSGSRCRYPHTPAAARDSPGIPTGGTHPTV